MEIIKIKYIKDTIIKQSEEIERCFKCSACSIFCPVTLNVSKYNIENAFISQLFGEEELLALKDVWMCSACEKCILVCPQDAEPAEVFNNLKRLSYQKGQAPVGVYAVTKQILNTGLAYDISAKINADRKKIELKELSTNESVSKELKIIAEKTGLKMEGE
ncbi:MAG TPA: 4Fe-4S dicluster domain-containing protein [Candidatus Nanopelagicaceae bacterium]|nr:4Fe-4S dicluster domain-containing protein [Candidatus Nanopelagicaceae bacterium]